MVNEFNKDTLKPRMIVKCKNGLKYRVNFTSDTVVGLTYVHEDHTPDEFCTYTDIEYDEIMEIVKDA